MYSAVMYSVQCHNVQYNCVHLRTMQLCSVQTSSIMPQVVATKRQTRLSAVSCEARHSAMFYSAEQCGDMHVVAVQYYVVVYFSALYCEQCSVQ